METWIIWLIIAAIFVIAELLTSMVACFCIAVGCFVAFIVALCDYSLNSQLVALALGTVISLVVFIPLFKKRREKNAHKETHKASNMDALIGKIAVVTHEIPANATGRVQIDGDSWQARSANGGAIAQGEKIKVINYDSIVLEVEAI